MGSMLQGVTDEVGAVKVQVDTPSALSAIAGEPGSPRHGRALEARLAGIERRVDVRLAQLEAQASSVDPLVDHAVSAGLSGMQQRCGALESAASAEGQFRQ